MPGKNDATPTATPAIQHIPATAARGGDSTAQAARSGARATQAAVGHDSGGKAVAKSSPEKPATANGTSARAAIARPARLPVRSRGSTVRRRVPTPGTAMLFGVTCETVGRLSVKSDDHSVSSTVKIVSSRLRNRESAEIPRVDHNPALAAQITAGYAHPIAWRGRRTR